MRPAHTRKACLAALVLTVCGCLHPLPTPAADNETRVVAHPLTGTWRFTLAIVGQATASGAHPTEAGEVTFVEKNGGTGEFYTPLRRVTHVGKYTLEHTLEAIPLAQDTGRAAAELRADRAITIILNPGHDHGSVIMTGAVYGDSITGSWIATSYAVGPKGSFRMIRLRNTR